MRLLSGKAFAKILERKGWTLRRVHGSHHIYGKSGSTVRISVPVHGSTLLKRGLQRHLAKLAEITDKDLA
jgi:predicted RNA binding protein YcfA (HicA-like mRNA interferase family)